MSPKNLVLIFVIGLCAAQAVHAAAPSRKERGIAELLSSAKEKLTSVLHSAEDAARSSVETVFNYAEKLEDKVLEVGTQHLQAAGYQVDLKAIADLFKSNIKLCTTDDVKNQAKGIIGNVASCITKDTDKLSSMVHNMQELWKTAQTLPTTMKEVADQCSAHTETDVEGDALEEFHDATDHDLATESNTLLVEGQKTLSKRDLWGLGRAVTCVRSVYDLVKDDLKHIPGQIVSTAADAFNVVKSAQGGLQTCVAKKVVEQGPAVSKLALEVGSCVAKGVSEGEDLDEALKTNPSLASLKQLAEVANKLEEISNSDALKAAGTVANLLG